MTEPRILNTRTAPPVPERAAEPYGTHVCHAPEWEAWLRETFIAEDAPALNPDHKHLRQADIAVVFQNEVCRTKGRTVIGTCALGEPSGNDAWKRAMKQDHMERLCGRVPDFLVTLSGLYVAESLERGEAGSVCALVEHELYHATQALTDHGTPRFSGGRPKWTIRGHDVEEFVGVVARYGAEAAGVAALVAAANEGPTFDAPALSGICGTCKGRL